MGRVGLALALLAACGCVRAGVPEADADRARQLLEAAPPALVLDLRDPEPGQRTLAPEAKQLKVDEVAAYLSRAAVPVDRPLLFACARGNLSQIAGAVALARGHREVYSLKGGMTAWSGPTVPLEGAIPAPLRRPLVLQATRLEQALTVGVGIGVKATYMALALLIAVLLWRSQERGLVLIRQAMVAFFFGEGMCAANFLLASGQSDSIELFHGLGMVGMGMLLPWGLSRLLDDRVLRYEDPAAGCAAQRLCGRCWKRDPVPCGLQRLFLFFTVALGVTSLLPLSGPLLPIAVEIPVFASTVVDQVSAQLQIVEFRIYPALAAGLFAIAFALLLGGRRTFAWSQPFFFAGLGLMSFSLMRFFLLRAFHERILWADAWEEATEFLAIAFVLFLLWVFRSPLDVFGFLRPRTAAPPGSG